MGWGWGAAPLGKDAGGFPVRPAEGLGRGLGPGLGRAVHEMFMGKQYARWSWQRKACTAKHPYVDGTFQYRDWGSARSGYVYVRVSKSRYSMCEQSSLHDRRLGDRVRHRLGLGLGELSLLMKQNTLK